MQYVVMKNLVQHSENIGGSYKHPNMQEGTEKATNFLTGSFRFQVAEIEVFQLV